MELFSGGNLNDYIKSNGVLNVLFRTKTNREENEVVLADFGLASFNTVDRYIFPKCGTPGYVAPEIAAIIDHKAHYALKCDLYSVGVTLYFMLTGQLPYPGANDILEKNRKCHLDFEKSKIFMNLKSESNCFYLFSLKNFYFNNS